MVVNSIVSVQKRDKIGLGFRLVVGTKVPTTNLKLAVAHTQIRWTHRDGDRQTVRERELERRCGCLTRYYPVSQTMRAFTGLDPRHRHPEKQMTPDNLTMFMLLWSCASPPISARQNSAARLPKLKCHRKCHGYFRPKWKICQKC